VRAGRLLWLARRNLRRRLLSTSLTTLSVALGVGLFAALGALRRTVEEGFQRSAQICDTVVGPRGSALDLVLTTLYHLGTSSGNVPFSLYEELHETPGVRWAVPLAQGDTWRGYRVLGVTDTLFRDVEIPGLGPLAFAAGEAWSFGHEDLSAFHRRLAEHFQGGRPEEEEAGPVAGRPEWLAGVIGSEVAARTGLGVGDVFVPAHDLAGAGGEAHEEAACRVTGVLEPTGTPLDRALFIPLGAFYSIAGHQPREDSSFGGARDPLGLSAILLRTQPGFYQISIWRRINDRQDAMAARPVDEVRKLFQVVGSVDQALRLVAALVVAVALVGVMVALYNAMGARRREFAVLRALGARRRTVLALVLAESGTISLAGGFLGLILAGAAALAAGGYVEEALGLPLRVWPGAAELLLLPAVGLSGALAGLVPAWTAYRTEAARHLGSHA